MTITNKTTARKFIATLEAYEKRSKYITIVHKYVDSWFCGVQVNISKNNKVTKEMVDYIASVFPYVEEEKELSVVRATWYKSHEDEQSEDVYESACCVSYH